MAQRCCLCDKDQSQKLSASCKRTYDCIGALLATIELIFDVLVSLCQAPETAPNNAVFGGTEGVAERAIGKIAIATPNYQFCRLSSHAWRQLSQLRSNQIKL